MSVKPAECDADCSQSATYEIEVDGDRDGRYCGPHFAGRVESLVQDFRFHPDAPDDGTIRVTRYGPPTPTADAASGGDRA